jgi:hypothetical protein
MKPEIDDRERVRDFFFAFAQSCCHMVDWLGNDPSRPIPKSEAKQYALSSPALSFCAEICNGSKHARLEEKDVDLSVTETMVTDYRFHPNEGRKSSRERIVQRLHLEWQGESVLALVFADKCITEWDQLLRSRGLLKE